MIALLVCTFLFGFFTERMLSHSKTTPHPYAAYAAVLSSIAVAVAYVVRPSKQSSPALMRGAFYYAVRI